MIARKCDICGKHMDECESYELSAIFYKKSPEGEGVKFERESNAFRDICLECMNHLKLYLKMEE